MTSGARTERRRVARIPPVGGRSADRVFFIVPQRLARVGFAMERLL